MQTGLKRRRPRWLIGRGQRELIIGDRQIGKTAVAIDTFLNQKPINEGTDESRKALLRLRRRRPEASDRRPDREDASRTTALEYSIVVAATASDPALHAVPRAPTPAAPWVNTSATTACTP